MVAYVTVGLLLLASFSRSVETCGWVVWKKAQFIRASGFSEPTWEIEDATQGFEECRKVREGVVNAYLKPGTGDVGARTLVGNQIQVAQKESIMLFTMLCLPSDIDPRPRIR